MNIENDLNIKVAHFAYSGHARQHYISLRIGKYAFAIDIHPLLDQSTCGNNYHRNIVVINTTEHFA